VIGTIAKLEADQGPSVTSLPTPSMGVEQIENDPPFSASIPDEITASGSMAQGCLACSRWHTGLQECREIAVNCQD